MTWDPRKAAGEMCSVWDCPQESPGLHGILRRCASGHQVTSHYCDGHIDEMMALAVHPPGFLEDGTVLGKLLCPECHVPLEAVLEGGA